MDPAMPFHANLQYAGVMPLELDPFRFRDPVTGKWVRARYKATLESIRNRHAEWEVVGPAEQRTGAGIGFNPWYKLMTHAEIRAATQAEPATDRGPLEMHPHLAVPPAIDSLEAFLVRRFLRRYIAYCARRRRFAQMNGAARLFAEIPAVPGAPLA